MDTNYCNLQNELYAFASIENESNYRRRHDALFLGRTKVVLRRLLSHSYFYYLNLVFEIYIKSLCNKIIVLSLSRT